MHRFLCLTIAIGAAACSSGGPPSVAPSPAAQPASATAAEALAPTSESSSPVTSFAAVPPPIVVIDVDSMARNIVAADSAADAAALSALEQAYPDTAAAPAVSHGGGADDLDVVTSWDIDVETYVSHERVQYYLDFFQGPGRERMAIWLTRLPRYEADDP